MTNADMPAIPVKIKASDQAKAHGFADAQYQGLTKREVFAMHAMQGFVAKGTMSHMIPKLSIEVADSLLAELDK